MPGCLEDARAVVRGEFQKLPACERVSSTEGRDDCSRVVYRVGDVVYKIDDDRPDNEIEFKILTDLAHFDWAPPVSLFDVDGEKIICMPYYANDPNSYLESDSVLLDIADHLIERMRAYGNTSSIPTGDMHSGNYRIVGPDRVMVIDAAGDFNF